MQRTLLRFNNAVLKIKKKAFSLPNMNLNDLACYTAFPVAAAQWGKGVESGRREGGWAWAYSGRLATRRCEDLLGVLN